METIMWSMVGLIGCLFLALVAIWKSPHNKRAIGIMLITSATADEEKRSRHHAIEKARRIAEDDMRVSHGMRPVHYVVHDVAATVESTGLITTEYSDVKRKDRR